MMPMQRHPARSGQPPSRLSRSYPAGVGAVLLCGAWLIWSGGLTPAQEKAKAPLTSTALVELKDARLVFINKHEVAFDRPGVLQFVLEEGESVEKGQVVARLDDRIAKAAVEVAQARVLNTAEVISAQKQAELADLKYKVTKKNADEYNASHGLTSPEPGTTPTPITPELNAPPASTTSNGKGVGDSLYPSSYLDELRLTAEAARSDVGRFEKEHEVNVKGVVQAQAELSVLELKAPRAGLVTWAYKQTGEGVQSGEKVLDITSTSRIRVEVNVPAVTAARLKVGMPITVVVQQPTGETAMNLERYPTVLKFIDPTIEDVSQKVRIWAEIDNSLGQLREGLRASIEIVPGTPAPATKPQ